MNRKILAGMAIAFLLFMAIWSIYNLVYPVPVISEQDGNFYKALSFSFILWSSLGYINPVLKWSDKG